MRRNGRVVIWVGAVLALWGLACIGLALPGDIVVALLAGWAFFVARVAPEITVNWSSSLVALLTVGILGLGLHRFLRWFYPSVTNASPGDRTWRRTWTAICLATAVLMFWVGICMIGVGHQLAWLVTSDEPFVDRQGFDYFNRQSSNNLKVIALALHNYHAKSKSLPAGGSFNQFGEPLHGWQSRLLPFIDLISLHSRIDFQSAWNDPVNAEVFRTRLKIFLNPGVNGNAASVEGYAFSHYAANGWVIGGNRPLTFNDIKDGTSNTILVGEVAANFKPWGHPMNWRDPKLGINKSPEGFGGPYKDAAWFCFADGSVRIFNKKVDPKILKALSTPNGGEHVGDY